MIKLIDILNEGTASKIITKQRIKNDISRWGPPYASYEFIESFDVGGKGFAVIEFHKMQSYGGPSGQWAYLEADKSGEKIKVEMFKTKAKAMARLKA